MKKKKTKFLSGIFVIIILINLSAWCSRTFSDLMRRTVFFVMQYFQGHISSLFPFSVGEKMLILALFLLAAGVFFAAARFYLWVRDRKRYRTEEEREAEGKNFKFRRVISGYFRIFLWIFVTVSAIMSINCFILYHCSSFGEEYIPVKEREYTVKELALVRDHVISQCNELAEEMERDEYGQILYEGDLKENAVRAMKSLGKEYPLLSGYYPTPKELSFSGFFSQQYIMGYYFPFSMEANYNGTMYIANKPVTLCHELSHAKGFIYEDDANFIGYLACISSDDAFFRYSGYLSVVDYLNADLFESLGDSRELYLTYAQCSPLTESDNIFLTKEAWEEVESNAIISTDTVKKASRDFLEMNLQLNGVEAGTASYGRVVEYLLKYYDGVLY